jgi:hypothetical protein
LQVAQFTPPDPTDLPPPNGGIEKPVLPLETDRPSLDKGHGDDVKHLRFHTTTILPLERGHLMT